jgi:protein-S-isoprenylcysteine O-methyltransferase Ste14
MDQTGFFSNLPERHFSQRAARGRSYHENVETKAGLIRKGLSGAARFFILLGLLLFGTAGTFRYWQAWLFLAIMAGCVLVLALYFVKHDPPLVERRLSAGPAAETRPQQKLIQGLVSVAGILLVAIAGFDHRFGWSHVPAVLVLAADAAIVAAFLLTFLVFRENSFASAIVEVGENQRVISTGPYHYVRHPMYSASLVMFFAMPIALGSWWALLLAPVIFALIVWRLIDEERLLDRELPGYAEYRRATPYRLAPLVW